MGVNQTLLQKVAENWSGFNYSNVGPGGLIRTRTLPQSNGMGGSKTWGAAGAAPAAQPAADLPMKAIPPAMKAIPQKASPAALGAGAAGMAAPKAQAAGAGAAQPQSRVNPYDDPNYDHYSNPGLDVIKHLRNATRPVRKELHPAIMQPTKQGADTMSINPELLQKAAKVYEAAESLDGEKPKHVYESHKKCAPGEFNMNKEGYAKLQGAIAKIARQKVAGWPVVEALTDKSVSEGVNEIGDLRATQNFRQNYLDRNPASMPSRTGTVAPNGTINWNRRPSPQADALDTMNLSGGPNVSPGRIPYPIRGAGRMGSVPALQPRDHSEGRRETSIFEMLNKK